MEGGKSRKRNTCFHNECVVETAPDDPDVVVQPPWWLSWWPVSAGSWCQLRTWGLMMHQPTLQKRWWSWFSPTPRKKDEVSVWFLREGEQGVEIYAATSLEATVRSQHHHVSSTVPQRPLLLFPFRWGRDELWPQRENLHVRGCTSHSGAALPRLLLLFLPFPSYCSSVLRGRTHPPGDGAGTQSMNK